MSDRTFFVRLNLDDMAAEVVGLESSEERGQWLDGFLVGSRGKDAREGWPEPKQDGHRFGLSCHHEAESFREKKAAAGEASANARRGRYGSAQPNTARTPLEQCSNTARTSAEQTPNHPTSNIQHPTTIIQKRSTSNESFLEHQRIDRPQASEIAGLDVIWSDSTNIRRTFDEPSLLEAEGKRKGKRNGQGSGNEEIESIYQAYPKKVAKIPALKAIERALRKVSSESLLESTRSFARSCVGKDPQYIPHPATWFNAGRWEDEGIRSTPSVPLTFHQGDLSGIDSAAVDRL